MLAHLSDAFKKITFNKTVTFASLGDDMIKFVIDFGLIITIGEFPSIVLGLQLKRTLAYFNGLILIHFKHQDLTCPIQLLMFLNVIANIRHKHPSRLA
jgi:hypothetical protein